jgi:hypothetical protein
MEIIIIAVIVIAAVAAVIIPLVRGGTADTLESESLPVAMSDEEIERHVQVYRAALRAGTLCRRCSSPNPAGSRFCHQCGRRLRRDEVVQAVV